MFRIPPKISDFTENFDVIEKIKVDCGAPLTPLATPRPSNLLVVRQRQKSLHLGENKTVTKLVELTHDVQIEPDQKPSLR